LPLAEVSASSINNAAQAVLTQPAYREAAQAAARAIAKLHPIADAVSIVEQALALPLG